MLPPKQFHNVEAPSPTTTQYSINNSTFAFAFDIDGVLLHSTTPTPTALTTLTHLTTTNTPFILLTNSGGHPEPARASTLTNLLSLTTPLTPSQIIQAHTPFQLLLPEYAASPILILGGEANSCRNVAHTYGFTNVITSADIITAYPLLSPFTINKTPSHAQPLPEGVRFSAVLVFGSPRDWALDLQLLVDVVMSDNGKLGTRWKKGGGEHIPVWFCNPDVVWSTAYGEPRISQGAFRAAFEAVYKAVGGGPELRLKSVGKPEGVTFKFAERALVGMAPGVRTVYMIGDNPKSDVEGANAMVSEWGVEWVSVLVEGGVWRSGELTNGARVVVENVWEGVKWAFEQEKLKMMDLAFEEEKMKEMELALDQALKEMEIANSKGRCSLN